MPSVLLSLLLVFPCATPQGSGPGLEAPRLTVGTELLYRGTIVESSDRPDNRFRKESQLEVRIVVLNEQAGAVDCTLATSIRPKLDPRIAGSARAVTGETPIDRPPMIRLAYLRIDERGRVKILQIRDDDPKQFDERTPRVPPADTPPPLELGMFLPLPSRRVGIGSEWEERPGVTRKIVRETVHNGGRCLELETSQKGKDFERSERILVVPSEGIAEKVTRSMERRQAGRVMGRIETELERDSSSKLVGRRVTELQRELDLLHRLIHSVDQLASKEEAARMLIRLERSRPETPLWGATNDLFDSLMRRCQMRAKGDPPAPLAPTSEAAPEPIAENTVAPDFHAPRRGGVGRFHLAEERGKPVVLIVYRPKSKSAPRVEELIEAVLHRYPNEVKVAAFPIEDGSERPFPRYDPSEFSDRYGLDYFPQFIVIDARGVVRWRFEGLGDETGKLLKRELEAALGRSK